MINISNDYYINEYQLTIIAMIVNRYSFLYFFMINISNEYYIKMNTVDNYCNDCQLIFI